MTDILLIRHGQASFGSHDYDRLSSLGYEQAHITSEQLRKYGLLPAPVCWSGTMQRQRETAAEIVSTSVNAALRINAAFNEYDSAGLIDLLGGDNREDAKGLAKAGDARGFQAILELALRRWASGVEVLNGETWGEFHGRVMSGLSECVNAADVNQVIPVSTSAGVIASVMSSILNLDVDGFLAINRRVNNASVTHIRYGKSGFSVLGFNDISGLRIAGEQFVTYR